MTAGPRIVWSDAALALFALDRPTAVSAGAGSGKTTCLVELCVRLLSGEATGSALEPREIVAITFTEKAAEELEERLREALADRAIRAREIGAADEARAWTTRLHALDAMAVGTIHGFAMRLLREHALEAGIDPEFAVLDEEGAQEWRREAALAGVMAGVDAGRAGTLALAGAFGVAGSRGGLAGAVAEIARERSTRGLAGSVEVATAEPAAAEGARAEVVAAVGELLALRESVRTATGTAALARLAEVWAALPREDLAGPFTAAGLERLGAVAAAVKGWNTGKNADARAAKERLTEAVARLVPLAAGVLASPQADELAALVADAEARFVARKAAACALDFDDLLSGARDLLRRDAGARTALRARVRALLVDEYQDVNPLQQEIFDLLAGEAGGEPAPLLVGVGDLKQSIYRFRGADVSVFRGLIDRFTDGPGRVLHLSRNHRSSPEILAVVNEVSASCMQPPAAGARPYELAFRDEDRLVAVRDPGGSPACELVEDGDGGNAAERRRREAEAIAARILAIVSGDAGVAVRERQPDGAERTRRPGFGDVAVLFRRLTQLGEYEHALRAAGIPVRLARGGGFYQAPEVRDLGELVASLFEPVDAIAWAALLRSPLCAARDASLLALARAGLHRLASRDAVAHVEQALAGVATADELDRVIRFVAEWHALRPVRDRLQVGELLQRAVDRLDVAAALLATLGGERRLANVRKALALAHRFGRSGGTAPAFARRLRDLARRPPREPEAELDAGDAVAILSVHQSKGLEWPIVFVPDLGATPRRDGRRSLLDGDGRLCASLWDPRREEFVTTASVAAAKSEAARAEAAESRRLLYVALTRARDHLVLSGDPGRNGGETWRGLVEPALAANPSLVTRVSSADARTFAAAPPVPGEIATPAIAAEVVAPPPLRSHGPTASPRRGLEAPVFAASPRLPVTALAEYARCPRRHALLRSGMAEPAQLRGAVQDDPGRATARGTLAHAMLAEVDFTAPPLTRREQLAATAARRGHDPSSPGVRRIAADVWRFIDSPAGRRLAQLSARGAVRRELPFVLRLDGDGVAPCYLVGAIDALVEERAGLTVVDFKYAMPRADAVARYRHQLLAYAVAAARARPRVEIRARLQFLRGPCTEVDVTPTQGELDAFAREAPFLAARMATQQEAPSVADLGRTAERCSADGCGFVSVCHRRT